MIVGALSLKYAAPAVLKGFRALRYELDRQAHDDGSVAELFDIDASLDEAIAVLAGQAETLVSASLVGLKGLISRPALFRNGPARHWIVTELAQISLRWAAIAAIRGEDDAPHAETAINHYQSFLTDTDAEDAPNGAQVYATALDFILRSLRRQLSIGERMVLGAVQGLRSELERRLPVDGNDTSDIIDEYVRDRVGHMRATRFFRSADVQTQARELADAVLDGRLKGASPAVRANALAWCGRVAAFVRPDDARAWCEKAARLSKDEEAVLLAKAFVAADEAWGKGLNLLDPLRSPAQGTAAFQIMRHGLQAAGALDRAASAGLEFGSLDPDGRYSWLTALVETKRLEDALLLTEQLTPEDFEETPALLWVAATVKVAQPLPNDLQGLVLQDLPGNAAHFPLPEDTVSLDHRRRAQTLMEQVADRCRLLELRHEATAAGRYALWLALRDPARELSARETLRTRVDTAGQELAYLPLALAFGLDVDRAKAADRIEQHLALSVDPTPETVGAMIALLVTLAWDDAREAKAYLNRHRTIFADCLAPESLVGIEVKILQGCGEIDQARAVLEGASAQALTVANRTTLASALDEESTRPTIAALETAYAQDPQSFLLVQLVGRYRELGVSPRYIELAQKLLTEMPAADFGEDIVTFLSGNGFDAEALEAIELLGDIVPRSNKLLAQAAWLNFRNGRLQDADVHLKLLEARRDSAEDRSLRYNLLVARGDWADIDTFIDDQWHRTRDRTPLELVQIANLAAQTGSKRAGSLIQAALDAAPNDPQVLSGAYNAMTVAGEEEAHPEAFQWIVRAAELSGEDGPVKQASIQELLDLQPDWEERVEEAQKALVGATAPIETIAGALRRPWLDLHLAPLLLNPEQADARLRTLVAPFCGFRRITPEGRGLPRRVAFDRTALVTLAALDLLDLLAKFDEVLIAHDTLSDLFEQRHKLTFHQPSRIDFAHRLLELVSQHKVVAFEPTSIPRLELTIDIGVELAALLSEAASRADGQHFLIHPFPITRVGSLLSDPVALEDYRPFLCSCTGVLNALVQAGRVASAKATAARAYFDQCDRPWPDELSIAPGATLYLSDLSVSYFRHVGLLDRIADAGFKVVVSKRALREAEALRGNERLTEQAAVVIERLRGVLRAGLLSGAIVLDAAPGADESPEAEFQALVGLVRGGDVLVSDDRFLNRHPNFEVEGSVKPILSTFDIVELLAMENHLSRERSLEIKASLWRSGVAFLPLSEEELLDNLGNCGLSPSNPEAIRETAELRAIRENLRLVQLRGWFDPSSHFPWLFAQQEVLSRAIAAQWTSEIADDLARARSNWLWALLDMRDWAQSVVQPNVEQIATHGMERSFIRLASVAREVEDADRYAAWLAAEVIEPLWHREPLQREVLLNELRDLVRSIAEDLHADTKVDAKLAARLTFDGIPHFLQIQLLEDEAFQKLVEVRLDTSVEIAGASFRRSTLTDCARDLYASPGGSVQIADEADTIWMLSTDAQDPVWPLRFTQGNRRLQVHGLVGLNRTGEARCAMLDAILAQRGVSSGAMEYWRGILAQRMLTEHEIEAVDKTLRDFPPMVQSTISTTLETNQATTELLVPDSKLYWERLAGAKRFERLTDYLEAPDRSELWWWAGEEQARMRWMLALASHPAILDGQFTLGSPEDWIKLGHWARDEGDPFAKIGFFEQALSRVQDDRALEPILLDILKQIEALDPEDKTGVLHLLASVAILTDGELSRSTALAEWSPWQRRMAVLAHATLITRSLQGKEGTDRFADFCLEQRGWRFLVQNLLDLRREPRWRPDYLAPAQLKHELIGRIFNAAERHADTLTPKLMRALLDEESGLRGRLPFPMAFWPGPLEGGVDVALQMPPEHLTETLETALGQEGFDLPSLVLFINMGATFRLPEDLVQSGLEKIQSAGPKLIAPLSLDEVQPHLLGLAFVAATGRNPGLAEAVHFLLRHHRQRVYLGVADEMQLALYCAAAHTGLLPWRKFLGAWLLDLAVTIDDRKEASSLLAWVDTISEIDPAFRAHAGRARGALRLVMDS